MTNTNENRPALAAAFLTETVVTRSVVVGFGNGERADRRRGIFLPVKYGLPIQAAVRAPVHARVVVRDEHYIRIGGMRPDVVADAAERSAGSHPSRQNRSGRPGDRW